MPDKKLGDKPGPQRDAGQIGEEGQAAPSGVVPGSTIQTGHAQHTAPMDCAACEAALADALDGLLDAERQKAFDEHAGVCEGCGQTVADARRGLAWLELLKQARPEPPSALLARILSQTSGPQTIGIQGSGVMTGTRALSSPLSGAMADLPAAVHGVAIGLRGQGAAQGSSVYPATAGTLSGPAYGSARREGVSQWATASTAHFRQTVLRPRMAMTAAMAFFSISLTLNLMGVRLADLKASDLKPSSLRRSFYEANAHVVRNLDNLRVVYEVEARVRDLRRASEPDDSSGTGDASGSDPSQNQHSSPADKQPKGAEKPGERKQPAPKGNGGTSRRESGSDQSGRHLAVEARSAEHGRPDDPSVLVEFHAAQQQAALRHRKPVEAMLYKPMKLEPTAPGEVKQVVTQGHFSASGVAERRMA